MPNAYLVFGPELSGNQGLMDNLYQAGVNGASGNADPYIQQWDRGIRPADDNSLDLSWVPNFLTGIFNPVQQVVRAGYTPIVIFTNLDETDCQVLMESLRGVDWYTVEPDIDDAVEDLLDDLNLYTGENDDEIEFDYEETPGNLDGSSEGTDLPDEER